MNAASSRDHRMKHMTMFPANWLTLGDDKEIRMLHTNFGWTLIKVPAEIIV